jgi:hypothetical protein
MRNEWPQKHAYSANRRASCHVTDAVAEQPAEVAHLFLEGWRRRIRIVLGVEEQRMPALRADIFVTAVAIGEFLVVVVAEETRQACDERA